MAATVFYWVVAALPVLPFVVIYVGYRHILIAKKLAVQQVLQSQGVRDSYLITLPITRSLAARDSKKLGEKKSDDAKRIVDELFDLYYQPASYVSAIVLNALVTIAIIAYVLIRAGVPLPLFAGLLPLAHNFLPTVAFGFAGAYLWSFYDLIRRYRAVDLAPSSFHFCWLRLLFGCIVGPLLAMAVVEGARNMVAFAIGVLPFVTLSQFFNELLRKRLGTSENQRPAEAPTLHNLQGMTKERIERMAEEGIGSAQALAYTDPIVLFLKTDLEWTVVVDLIDQALLFFYVGEKIVSLRPGGIRGSLDFRYLVDRLDKLHKKEVTKGDLIRAEEAKALIEKLPAILGMDLAQVKALGRILRDDTRVDLLQHLYFYSVQHD